MAAALPWVVAGVGAMQAQDQNRRANRQVDEGMDLQREQARRERELYELLLGKLDDAEGAGVFNPETAIAQLDKDMAEYEGRDTGNQAGALRIAGYRPGDSEVVNRSDAIKLKYRGERDRQASAIRRDLPLARIQAYSALKSPSLAGIGANISNAGMARMQDPSAMFQYIMPYLMPQNAEKPMAQQSWSMPTYQRPGYRGY